MCKGTIGSTFSRFPRELSKVVGQVPRFNQLLATIPFFGLIVLIGLDPDKGISQAASFLEVQNPMPQDFRGVKTGKVPLDEKIPLSSCFSTAKSSEAEQKSATKRISRKKFHYSKGN
jgi:hypothetical protein